MDLLTILGSPITELEHLPGLTGNLAPPETIEGRTHIAAPSLGLGFTEHGDGIVGTIHVHTQSEDGVTAFVGDLPCGLSQSMTRADVQSLLGAPESSGAAVTLPVLGSMPSWDRFVVDGQVYLHVSYRCEGPGLSLVTLMAEEFAPGA